ncbi:MAG: hypothetical protein KH301_06620 [Brachyspira sp.]|nr:hypothetical protein [Brachyspira sp.]
MKKIEYVDNMFLESDMQVIENATTTIKEIWDYQHPVMHIWFLMSAASLCFMFALLFFVV